VFERIKKRFGGSIEQAKSLLNARENIRCLRRGDNCSKERRVLLGVISALVAALVAAGVIIAGQAMLGKKGAKPNENKEKLIQELYTHALTNLIDIQSLNVLTEMARNGGIRFDEVRSVDGQTLIGAFMNRLQFVDEYTTDHQSIFNELLRLVKQPTDADMQAVKGLELALFNKTNSDIAKNMIQQVRDKVRAQTPK
jgi:hypothetical protein